MNQWAPVSVVPPPPGTQDMYRYQPVSAEPAYHPVQARQTFNQTPAYTMVPQQPPPSLQLQPVQEPQKKKIDWPHSVRMYVQRSFDPANVLDDIPRSEMEAKLKETISRATDSQSLDSTDWDNLPLPQHMIRQERAHKAWQEESLKMQMASNGYINPAREQFITQKKRKSTEMGGGNAKENSPPWQRATNNRNGFEDRVTFPEKRQHLPDDSLKGTSKFQKNLEKRQRRFDGGYKSTYQAPNYASEPSSGPVVGTSQTLEKQYFRLTAPPIPSQVRPEAILRQTLDLLKKKWKKEGNYSYICDQFKSMRQDLTVQRIKNEFTVTVYEIHARIALEKGDLGEYNQCQTQLKALYAQNLGGKPFEFKAYRILYFIHTSNRTALNDVLADLTTAEKKEKAIKHALDVRSALALGNYHRFFRLYLDTPNMGAYLMDMFVVRERLAALANMCKAFKPDVPLRYVTEELGFESDGDAAQFIYDYQGQALLEEKEDGLRFLTGKAGQLFEAARAQAFRKVDIKGQI
ncbi:hypothetical protein HYALB_00010239 [Hymenoscyphus albidus]|uniref:SAC3/GANP/THP3 conserved domain-containing protein n=1 Tax=Hymenoscyphus albidus TaxID=595503 RepID=A0A9N9LLB4_9HELO|nr:hypothetical protein HYALB_00010239 [Hymenoscyphus albidus]